MTITKKNLLKIVALSALTIVNANVLAAVPNTFTAGNAVIAAEMNDNFDNLDQRLTTLETSVSSLSNPTVSVAVDCSADANALLNTALINDTEYVLTGMCNGPIKVTGNKSITFIGDANGVKDDGIILPPGLGVDPVAAVSVFGPNQLVLDNLTISSSNYVTNNYSFVADIGVGVITAGHNARIVLTNIDAIGGDNAVRASHGGVITVNENTTVTGFNIRGFIANNNASILLRKPIVVTGLTTSTDAYPSAIGVYRNSSVEIKEGGTFASATGGNALEVADNGTVRVRSAGTTILNGLVAAYRSSVIRVDAGTLNGKVAAYRASVIRVDTGTLNGDIVMGDGSVLRLTDVDVNSPNNLIQFYRNSSGRFIGNTNLNNTDISCSAGDVSVSSSVLNKALVCGQ